MYVYIQSEAGLWTVGFYTPRGEWKPESDHDSQEKAAERAAWLNGGKEKEIMKAMEYNIAEKQRIIDEMIKENIEGRLFQANMEILEGLLKILEILTEKKHN